MNRRLIAPRWLALAVLVGAVVVCGLALLLWWLPARARAGYYVPDIRGTVSTTPQPILIWVRPWPWSTTPPEASVTYHLSGGERASALITAPPVPFFSARAVAVTPFTNVTPPLPAAGRITQLTVTWQGGQTSGRERHLFAVSATPNGEALGFAPFVTGTSSHHDWPLAVLLDPVPQAVLAVTSPNPGASPWSTPRCLSVSNLAAATQATAAHMKRLEATMTQAACRAMAGPEALVLAPRPPQADAFYIFQPIVRVLEDGRRQNITSGETQSGSVNPLNAFNWWLFLR